MTPAIQLKLHTRAATWRDRAALAQIDHASATRAHSLAQSALTVRQFTLARPIGLFHEVYDRGLPTETDVRQAMLPADATHGKILIISPIGELTRNNFRVLDMPAGGRTRDHWLSSIVINMFLRVAADRFAHVTHVLVVDTEMTDQLWEGGLSRISAVSYTHLTLPTN